MILHTINKSTDLTLLEQTIRYCSEDDAVLFLEDGVYFALKNKIPPETEVKFYVLQSDLEYRGIRVSNIPDIFEVISFDEYIRLTSRCAKIINWF